MKTKLNFILFLCFLPIIIFAQTSLITNINNRNTISLNGKWNIIIDPYEGGYYNYRYQPRNDGYFQNRKQKDKSELVEYDFDNSEIMNVPGDWNTQKEKLLYYEGTVWYKKSFSYQKKNNKRLFIYFGAINYQSIIYINGKRIGEHEGGFTPFNFEITDEINNGDNFIVVKVDNRRKRNGVPTIITDWWNYGGITRDVELVEVPETFIRDYFIHLKKGTNDKIAGWIQLEGKEREQQIKIQITEINFEKKIFTDSKGFAEFEFDSKLDLWTPENPHLYDVKLLTSEDTTIDQIGFRSIKTNGEKVLLNGKPVFLRGISIHEEAPFRSGRAYSKEDAVTLLTWAKELGCNFVRLAHYPHNENMVRQADKMGIMVWSEIPVYWTILWDDSSTYANALVQLRDMITRDKNRAAVILWSVANETPRGDSRLKFLTGLIGQAREYDATRLITAATEIHSENNVITLDDPLSKSLDVIGVNEYLGWYWGKPDLASQMSWKSEFNKPMIISELGGGALYNLHGDAETRWTEEYQENIYIQQVKMLKKIPFLEGVTPWILMDFRSPQRTLPQIQDGWNRKGLISDKGFKKKAFYVLKNFYKEIKEKRTK